MTFAHALAFIGGMFFVITGAALLLKWRKVARLLFVERNLDDTEGHRIVMGILSVALGLFWLISLWLAGVSGQIDM